MPFVCCIPKLWDFEKLPLVILFEPVSIHARDATDCSKNMCYTSMPHPKAAPQAGVKRGRPVWWGNYDMSTLFCKNKSDALVSELLKEQEVFTEYSFECANLEARVS